MLGYFFFPIYKGLSFHVFSRYLHKKQQLKMQWPEMFLKEEAWKNVNLNYCKRANGFSFILEVF